MKSSQFNINVMVTTIQLENDRKLLQTKKYQKNEEKTKKEK